MKLSVRWKRSGDTWLLQARDGILIASVAKAKYEYFSSLRSTIRYYSGLTKKMYFTPIEAKRAVERRLRLT